jgi:Fibronectin type III domain
MGKTQPVQGIPKNLASGVWPRSVSSTANWGGTSMTMRTRWTSRLLPAAAASGLALALAAGGVSYAVGARSYPAVHAMAASKAPELLKPTVTHEPDAYELLGVGCYSPSYCVAVGGGDGTFTGGVAVPIKNGKPGKPILWNTPDSSISTAACISASECVLAGEEPAGSSEQAVAWLLRDRKLTLLTQTNATNNVMAGFRSADCFSAKQCLVAGDATYLNASKAQISAGVFGEVTLGSKPSIEVSDNTSLPFADAVSCPSAALCYLGGSNGEAGAEGTFYPKNGDIDGPFAQPTVTDISGLACTSRKACGASEQESSSLGEGAGWVELLNGKSNGTPHAVSGSQYMWGIADVNQSYYLAVGSSMGDTWLTDLVTAAGKPLAVGSYKESGYLQGVSCPVQTECIAVGFTTDSNPDQPGGLDGVDGAIMVFHLKTAPSAPRLKVTGTTGSSVTLRITPPSSDGGTKVTSYHLLVTRCKPHKKACQQQSVTTVKVSGTAHSVTVRHLASHTTYYFEATASNAFGTGPHSARVHGKT